MIKISISILEENVSIVIDDGNISIDSKNKTILQLINSIYSELLASYSPADGSLGGNLTQELAKVGAKILELTEPPEEEDRVY